MSSTVSTTLTEDQNEFLRPYRHMRKTGAVVSTTSLGLQRKGRQALLDPLFSHTKYRCLQEKCSGRCWIRTSDFLLVREVLYP
jgi:hypothetical protein